jgi:hypothetical protein
MIDMVVNAPDADRVDSLRVSVLHIKHGRAC